jgi:hypothetical protein
MDHETYINRKNIDTIRNKKNNYNIPQVNVSKNIQKWILKTSIKNQSKRTNKIVLWLKIISK